MANGTGEITRIIACGVFKPALEHLKLEERYPNLRLTYLQSNLHLRPKELRKRLLAEVVAAKERKERVICLYGDCFPDIDQFCQRYEVIKVPGHYCYEMLLGTERFGHLLDEMTGTYFAEKELICNFEEYCRIPLELDDEEMRKLCFQEYKRLLYVRQPSDPDIIPKACELADFLELTLDIRDADYSHLERMLIDSIQQAFLQ